jgi:hypothetical protein
MRNKAAMLGLFAGMMMMGSTPYLGDGNDLVDTGPREPVVPPTPKGCKQYFFNESGEFSTTQMLKTECVFTCIASNDKTAKKKFEKWNTKDIQ